MEKEYIAAVHEGMSMGSRRDKEGEGTEDH